MLEKRKVAGHVEYATSTMRDGPILDAHPLPEPTTIKDHIHHPNALAVSTSLKIPQWNYNMIR